MPRQEITLQAAIEQGYSTTPPAVREDIPAMIIGYDAVEAFAHDVERRTRAGSTPLDEASKRMFDLAVEDLRVIREKLSEALELWGNGRDNEAADLIRQAIARASGR